MKNTNLYPIAIFLIIALLLGQWGCAHVPKPPSEEMKARFGTIGIVSSRSTNPKIHFHPEFAKGRLLGAGKGAGIGMGVGSLYGLTLPSYGSCTGDFCGAAFVILAATGAVVGGVIGGVAGGIKGAVNAVPKGEAKKIEGTIKNAFDETSIQKTMAARVFKNSLELPDHTFILLEKEDFLISTAYHFVSLKKKGIDTLLELNVKDVGFKEGKGKNPSIAFFMKVRAKLIQITDEKEIYSREFEYISMRHQSTDWLNSDAHLLREEIDNCFNELPRQITEVLFGKKYF